ncbi:hypothetical protein [Microbispora sp. NPDC046933]|uniref:hypothetical protein n=1 Tax=Microbispora sp. NPDC046933 TaxID=3155618 RepID=UPI0033D5ED10
MDEHNRLGEGVSQIGEFGDDGVVVIDQTDGMQLVASVYQVGRDRPPLMKTTQDPQMGGAEPETVTCAVEGRQQSISLR